MCFLKPSFTARSPLRPFTRSPQPTAMKQGTRRRMEQPINACGQFVCFTATCEIRKFLLMRLRWRVLTKKAFHFFTRIVKSSSSSFMVLPTDRPARDARRGASCGCQAETAVNFIWHESEIPLMLGTRYLRTPLAAFPPDVPLDINKMPIHKQIRDLTTRRLIVCTNPLEIILTRQKR